jgi:hypothetical protein
MRSLTRMSCGAGAAAALLLSAAAPRPQELREARVEAVVQRTCTPCHALPPPDVLPKRAWRAVTLDMTGLIVQGIGLPRGRPAPSPDFDFEQIAHHYQTRAPVELPSPAPWPPAGGAAERFTRRTLVLPESTAPAAVANVRFLRLDAGRPTEVVAADMVSGLLMAGGAPGGPPTLRVLGRVPHPCHLEALDLDRDGRLDLVAADLGILKPDDRLQGTVTWLRRMPDGGYGATTLAAGLPRVADVQAGDFDGDGDQDLVVAAFGWRRQGGILLLENRTSDWSRPSFQVRELDERTGAIHVPVVDLDRDGRLDFVALLSQHHEAVVAFLGDGKGGFRKETVDQAPHPAWGSSGMQLVDMDKDGDLDVLVTNGDMLDDYQLKPYHGVRWLENRGAFPFVPHALAALFGVMRAQAGDLDGDGDLDVVAAAMVQVRDGRGAPARAPDLPSLVWLERTAGGTYDRHTLERGGQHLSLDLADYDGDGDLDIVTANSLSGAAGHAEVWEQRGMRPIRTDPPHPPLFSIAGPPYQTPWP